MATKQQIEYLQQNIQHSIDTFSAKTRGNKNKAFFFKLTITLLSSLSTIDLGIDLNFRDATPSPKNLLHDIALILSASITIISWLDTFFSHKQMWVSYNTAVNELRELRLTFEYKQLQEDGMTANDVDDIKNMYQNILNKLNNNWTQLRSAE